MNVLGRALSLSLPSFGLLLGLAACSNSSGGGGGTLYIETCTLGCSSGLDGTQVSCQFNQAAVNQEIAVFFSEPVDPASISSASFEIIDVSSGSSPNGTRFRDPHNPRKVLFRPAISFESDGSINFGFDQNATYRVRLPGTSQGDPGPFIRSTSGSRNTSRLSCDIRTSQPAVDVVPGAPEVTILVKQAIPSTPDDPDDHIDDVVVTPLPVITDVWHGSDIQFVFNDLMNPATLADPVSGDAAFVTIEIDLDGNLATPDRTPLFGDYVVELDPIQLRTVMTFTPLDGIPSSGTLDPLINPDGLPRQIVITVPNNLQDLAGNALANPTTAPVIAEFTEIDPVTLPDANGEDFTDTTNSDVAHSGAAWGAGKLTRGQGGGRGRLGQLIVATGDTLVLSTDSQEFPLDLTGDYDILSNEQPDTDYDPLDRTTWPTITVTDGAFEFSSLIIESGGTLRFEGTRPARVLVRGNVNILGTLDVTGGLAPEHASTDLLGGLGGEGGPDAGDGAIGATRFDYGGTNMTMVGGADVPNAQVLVDAPRGQGLSGVDEICAGFGGVHWPTATPLTKAIGPPANADLTFSDIGGSCLSAQTGLPGGGGAYATDGMPGVAMTPVALSLDGIPNLPPAGSSGMGGPSSDAGLEPPGAPAFVRKLTFELGFLRGGSGGGGGGASVFGTESSGFAGNCLEMNSEVAAWRDHSGSGGGGGGGALQLVCGGPSLSITGRVAATGGEGGSALAVVAGDDEEAELRPKRGVPGGGGSGGAIRIQATNFPSTSLNEAMPPRISVAGGIGGINSLGSTGGTGGAGLIRLEGLTSTPNAAVISPLIAPTDVAIVGVDAINVLSIGNWNLPRFHPESYSGAVSCWMRPDGNFFQIVFLPDTPSNPDPALRYGWDMNVIYGPSNEVYSYRDPADSPFAGMSIEERFGNAFDGPAPGSYVVVRFQGARSAGDIADLCNVDQATQIVQDSLTPWVAHPEDLNLFSPRPNMIRFSVTFDLTATFGNPQNQIQGVTGLKIRTQPD